MREQLVLGREPFPVAGVKLNTCAHNKTGPNLTGCFRGRIVRQGNSDDNQLDGKPRTQQTDMHKEPRLSVMGSLCKRC